MKQSNICSGCVHRFSHWMVQNVFTCLSWSWRLWPWNRLKPRHIWSTRVTCRWTPSWSFVYFGLFYFSGDDGCRKKFPFSWVSFDFVLFSRLIMSSDLQLIPPQLFLVWWMMLLIHFQTQRGEIDNYKAKNSCDFFAIIQTSVQLLF